MEKPRLYKYLVIALSLLLVVAVRMSIMYNIQTQASRSVTKTICSYNHFAKYTYFARLENNLIYNKTYLRPGDGTLYTAIVKYLNLTFKYNFLCNPKPFNTTIIDDITFELESPEKWTRQLSAIETEELFEYKNGNQFSLILNNSKIEPIIESIDKETGIRTSTYNLIIKPQIHVIAESYNFNIDEFFTPTLTISFIKGGELGDYIKISELTHTRSDKITENTEITLQNVKDMRTISNFITIIIIIALAVSSYQFFKLREKKPKVISIKKIISQYEELITRTKNIPPVTDITVQINSLEDLARTAEILMKPIMYAEHNEEHIFYIIEDNNKYEYTTTLQQ